MSDNTKIEWADATVNYVNGCSVVSPGCTNCYAIKLAGTRLKTHPTRAGLTRATKAGRLAKWLDEAGHPCFGVGDVAPRTHWIPKRDARGLEPPGPLHEGLPREHIITNPPYTPRELMHELSEDDFAELLRDLTNETACAVAAAEKALVAKVLRILKGRPYADARELVPDVEALVRETTDG